MALKSRSFCFHLSTSLNLSNYYKLFLECGSWISVSLATAMKLKRWGLYLWIQLNWFTPNQVFLTCMLKSGELFFFSCHCFANFFGHSEAKDQVTPLLCFCRLFLCLIVMMAIFLSGSEYNQKSCFSSSKRVLMHFLWAWNKCSPFLLAMWTSCALSWTFLL